MAPTLKLTYFDIKGLAEYTRLILTYGKLEFEDIRLKKEEFADLKPTLPFGQLPILEVDGTVIAQSLAISRYAASLANLYPQDKLRAAKADMVVDTMKDLITAAVPIMFTIKDEEEKAEAKKKFLAEKVPKFLGGVEKLIEGDYVLGDELSYADIGIYDSLTNHLLPKFEDIDVSMYPKLKAIQERIAALPELAEYFKAQQEAS